MAGPISSAEMLASNIVWRNVYEQRLADSGDKDTAIRHANEARRTFEDGVARKAAEQAPMTKANATSDLLAERAKTHGDFTEHARITQLIKATMQSGQNYNKLARTQIEALDMIAHKIGRIIAGDPNHKDHWDDIAGYATLVSERI